MPSRQKWGNNDDEYQYTSDYECYYYIWILEMEKEIFLVHIKKKGKCFSLWSNQRNNKSSSPRVLKKGETRGHVSWKKGDLKKNSIPVRFFIFGY